MTRAEIRLRAVAIAELLRSAQAALYVAGQYLEEVDPQALRCLDAAITRLCESDRAILTARAAIAKAKVQ